ncbi:unnamed protein product [Cunninghamella blakesleeana]
MTNSTKLDKQVKESIVNSSATLNGNQEHRNVVEHEPRRIREDPVAFVLNMGLYYQGTGWRGYQEYVGNKIFYPQFSANMRAKVLESEAVNKTIDDLAEKQAISLLSSQSKWQKLSDKEKSKMLHKQKKALRKELQAVAKGIAEKSVAKLDSIRFIRFFAFTVNNILVRLYHQGIHIKESEWMELKRIALIAQERNNH